MTSEVRVKPGQWELLKALPPRSGELRAASSGVVVAAGEVMIALDGAQRRHLLVPVGGPEDVREDTRSAGCRVVFRELVGYRGRYFSDMACLRHEVSEVFGLLADDVLRRIESNASTPGDACAEALEDWRDLLGGQGGPQSAGALLLGLFGELWLLRRLARSGSSCLEAWVGPSGAPQDFSRGLAALEIKTTSSATGTAVEIHGLKQLMSQPGGSLFLGLLRVEHRPGNGETVSDLISDLYEAGLNSLLLRERLEAAGYYEAEKDPVAAREWSASDFSLWSVTGDFPCITPDTFPEGNPPPGLSTVNYVIDLSAVGRRCSESEAEALLSRLAAESDK